MTEQTEAATIAEEQIAEFASNLQSDLARYGDDAAAQMSAEDFLDGLRGNHEEYLIVNAAAGVVAAIIDLRAACGLPILS